MSSGHSKRVAILIDGSNFYHLVLKKFGIQPENFDFDGFVKLIQKDRFLVSKTYYTGTISEYDDNPRSKVLMAQQTTFLTALSKVGWCIETSKLRRKSEKIVVDSRTEDYKKLLKYGFKEIVFRRDREKDIDVKIAIDLVIGAFENRFDSAILVSSDHDFLPAIEYVRNQFKKKIEYIGFSYQEPNAKGKGTGIRPAIVLSKHSDTNQIIYLDDLKHLILTP